MLSATARDVWCVSASAHTGLLLTWIRPVQLPPQRVHVETYQRRQRFAVLWSRQTPLSYFLKISRSIESTLIIFDTWNPEESQSRSER